ALADKLDTIVSFFSVGETPSGSRDPFAVRRAAIGVIALMVSGSLRVPLQLAVRELVYLLGRQTEARLLADEAVRTFLKLKPNDAVLISDALGRIRESTAIDAGVDMSAIAAMDKLLPAMEAAFNPDKWQPGVLEFFADRLKVQQRDA